MSIETDTPILPYVIADNVVRELCQWMYETHQVCLMPGDQSNIASEYLAEFAEQIYKHNDHFRGKVKAKSNRGRDMLYVFMRHWLAGWVKDNLGQTAFERLPQSYLVGRELPRSIHV